MRMPTERTEWEFATAEIPASTRRWFSSPVAAKFRFRPTEYRSVGVMR